MRARLAFCTAIAVGSLTGCAVESTATPEPEKPAAVTQAGVVTFATFARVLDDTKDIAEGLDIDGLVSTEGDEQSCGKLDFISPDGEPGIDNQFGGLLPVIEKFVGAENIGQLLATAIANGQLLILMAIDDVDDPTNDDDVNVRIAAGLGVPLLDSKGAFVTYQTFGVDRETAPVSKLKGRIENGVLHVGPGNAVLPVRVLDAKFNLELHGVVGRVALTQDPLGSGFAMDGMLAGGLAVDDFKGIVKSLTIGSDVMDAATGLIGLVADLAPDEETGRCTQVSAALRIQTTPAFILD